VRLTRQHTRVLREVGAGVRLDLPRDWMRIVELADMGLIETRKASTGQLEIVGLTATGRELHLK
jgi:hypothetical protein